VITTVANNVVAEQHVGLDIRSRTWAALEGAAVQRPLAVGARPIFSAAKRTLDVLLALVALILIAPILVAVAIAVHLSSPGPVFFHQTRVGLHGRPFTCLKFRTMIKDAERVLELDPELGASFVTCYKLKEDYRVTRVGAVLRKLSLDELPQFVNVLRGDMSLVGPRPVPAEELRHKYGPAGHVVVSVRPGLTGLWQVSGRSTTTYEERVQLDLSYVERRSPLMDTWIVIRTPIALLTMRGAH
jgi:exopolysaccharide production protein ExoY